MKPAPSQCKPTFVEEATLWRQGFRLVAGVDEVGRGPLAGPVLAAAVILPRHKAGRFDWLDYVRDSKELFPSRRATLAACIWRDALAVGIGLVSHAVIDEIGIVEATRRAMLAALAALAATPEYVIVDFLRLPELSLPQKPIVDGDALSLSIACASIVAKVARDRLMVEANGHYEGYGFARNKGYATREHLEALRRLGPCPLHRRTYAPVKEALSCHSEPFALGHSERSEESKPAQDKRSEESGSQEPETLRYAQGDKKRHA